MKNKMPRKKVLVSILAIVLIIAIVFTVMLILKNNNKNRINDIAKAEAQHMTEAEATAQGYTIIHSADELKAISDLSGKYILMQNIDLLSSAWTPLGTSDTLPFTGAFDGNNFTIGNIKIESTNQYIGMFGVTNGATIKNLTLDNITLNSKCTSNNIFAGTVIGNATDTTLDNVKITGKSSITFTNTSVTKNIGGLVAKTTNGSVNNCSTNVNITGNATNVDSATGEAINAGGLIGITEATNITSSFATGEVNATVSSGAGVVNAGGLIGRRKGGSIDKVYSTGKVNATSYTGAVNAGGLIGKSIATLNLEADVPLPALDGFNKEITYYVTYDSEGNEDTSIPLTQDPPSNWYEYGKQAWANIVVKNNGKIAYFTWIPRYMYKLDNETQTADVIFVDINNKNIKTQEAVDSSYTLSDAFTWDTNINLTGYWISKWALNGNYESKYNSSSSNSPTNWAKGIRKMECENGILGLTNYDTIDETTLASTGQSNNIDIHLQKNTEYGTCVILGASQYGKQGENNTNSSTSRYMNIGETTQSGVGVKATTTGNVTGVYSSDSCQWTAGGADSFLSNVDSRYINRYTTAESSAIPGDATVETKYWHTTGTYFNWVNSSSPGFGRGGANPSYGAFCTGSSAATSNYGARAGVVCGAGI